MNARLVVQLSPDAALGAAVVPTSRSAAGATGRAARAPPASAGPSCPPAGAVAERPSGRSAGANALRWALSVYPAPSVLVTVIRSVSAAGESPGETLPKLRLGFSSAIESVDCRSSATFADPEAEPAGGGVPLQVVVGRRGGARCGCVGGEVGRRSRPCRRSRSILESRPRCSRVPERRRPRNRSPTRSRPGRGSPPPCCSCRRSRRR